MAGRVPVATTSVPEGRALSGGLLNGAATYARAIRTTVLTAILQCGRKACGVTIHEAVEALSGTRSVSLGAVYATLDRLEDKGLIPSWLADPTPERGGRSKRHYRLESDGERALRESALTARRICAALEVHPRPPVVIENIVRLLVPPASREHVMGDLRERYRSPRQYLLDVFQGLPLRRRIEQLDATAEKS